MKYIKLWSKIFLWIGFISTIILIFLLILLYCISVPSDWYDMYRPEVLGIKNIFLIIAPFSFIIGYAIKSIYTELLIIHKKIDRKMN